MQEHLHAGQAIIRCVCDAISPISIITPSVRAYGDNRNTTAEINLLLASVQSCDVLHSASMRRIDWRLVTRHFVKHTSPRVEHDAYLAIAVVYIFITWQHYFFCFNTTIVFYHQPQLYYDVSAFRRPPLFKRHRKTPSYRNRTGNAFDATKRITTLWRRTRLWSDDAITHAHTHSHRFISWPCGFIPRCTYSRFEAQCH